MKHPKKTSLKFRLFLLLTVSAAMFMTTISYGDRAQTDRAQTGRAPSQQDAGRNREIPGTIARPETGQEDKVEVQTPLSPFIDLQEAGLTLDYDGVGLESLGAGTATLTVNIGGPVRFALLYWAGQDVNCPTDMSMNCAPFSQPYKDQQITFEGTNIPGTVIGTETSTNAMSQKVNNIGYFADVTSIVSAAGPGLQTFTFADDNLMSNLTPLLGASLIVAYTDASDPETHRLIVWDNLDYAFADDPTPGDARVTAPVTFNHGADMAARTATLITVVGNGKADRPDSLTISNNPTVFNSLNSSDGNSWDTDGRAIDIPANVSSTTVQFVSAPAGENPDALLWEAAVLYLGELDVEPPTCDQQFISGPPAQLITTTQDVGSGLAEILVTKSQNADTVVPPFTVGTNDPVTITSTKIDQSMPMMIEIRITDLAGNVTFCDFPTCITPPLNMTSWWPADGTAEDIVGNNEGTLTNGATFGSGQVGQAFQLDGIDDFVNVPDSNNLDFAPTAPITVDAWVFRTGSASVMHILGKRDGCSSFNYQMAFDTANGLQFNSSSGGVFTGVQLPMNQWVHLAATFDGTTFTFYIDGTQVATGTGTLGPVNTAPFRIGASGTCGSTFAGLIDEVEIFNRALSAEEIAALADEDIGKCRETGLTITKTDNQTTVVAGDSVTYTITVSNAGPLEANGATVTDVFPPQLMNVTYTSMASGGATGNTTMGVGDINDTVNLPVGSSITYMATGTLSTTATGTVSNTATVTPPETLTDDEAESATDTNSITPLADLSIVKTDNSDTEVPGTTVTYTITVTNAGPGAVTGATVTDMFPSTITGVTFTSMAMGGATGNTTMGMGNISDTVDLPAGSSIVYTATGTISPSATGTLSNTATVSSNASDPNTNNNSSTDTDALGAQANLSVTKTDSPDPAQAGGLLTYTITLTNNGPSDAQNVFLNDNIPANTMLSSAMQTSGPTFNPASGGGSVSWSIDTFAAGQSATFSIVVSVNCSAPNGAIISNTATVTTTTTDLDTMNNMSTATTTVNNPAPTFIQACPAPITAVTAPTCPVQTGTIVTFPTPTASDAGDCPVTVVCNPPSGAIFPVGTTTVTCTATDAANQTITCSFTVTVFNACIQDDTVPGKVILFNTITGEYRACCGTGTRVAGQGTVTRQGCIYTLQHNAPGWRVTARIDFTVKKGSGSIQLTPGNTVCTITDRDIRNNSCVCAEPPHVRF